MQIEQKYKVIDRDMMKYIAVVPMAIGHFVDFYFGADASINKSFLLYLIARSSLIASPIFFFFIAEGFRHTGSLKKYAARLLIFSVITQIPYSLMNFGTLMTPGAFTYLNVFFTLFLGLAALRISTSDMKLWLKILLIVLLDALTVAFYMQWTVFGIPIILVLYHFRDDPRKRTLLFSLCSAASLLMLDIPAAALFFNKGRMDMLRGVFIGLVVEFLFLLVGYFIVTLFYNGEKGKHPAFSKWFFYIFYPSHLLVIFIAKLLAGKY